MLDIKRIKTNIRDLYATAEVNLRKKYHNRNYASDINPYDVIYVDPSKVTLSMTSFDHPNRRIAGKVMHGDWDLDVSEFLEMDGDIHFDVLRSFKKRFEEESAWEETDFYNKLLNYIEQGQTKWGCENEKDVERRCSYLDNLYNSIATKGYKTQDEIGSRRLKVYKIINGEIAINIGRDGELIFYDGRNRLAISKIIGLNRVPVVVLVRHKQWQDTRDQIMKRAINGKRIPEKYKYHPDMGFLHIGE